MDESDDDNNNTLPAPTVVENKQSKKLPGLRPILSARKIERKVLARQIGIDLGRLSNIIGTSTRANSDEIDRITQTLDVTLEQLLAPDISPPRRRSMMTFADEPDDDDDEVTRDGVSILPEGDVVLNMALPDGRKFSVGSNQTLSNTMLTRMTQALAILAGTNDEK